MSFTPEQEKALLSKVGEEATKAAKDAIAEVKAIAEKAAKESIESGGFISDKTFKEFEESQKEYALKMDDICRKQGLSISALELSLSGAPEKTETLSDAMHKQKDRLQKGETVKFMVFQDENNRTKAIEVVENDKGGYSYKQVGPHSTTDAVQGAGNGPGGNVASISSALTSATILRMGAGATFNSVYRNSSFLFDQVNLIQAGFESNRVFWMDEVAPDGTSNANTLEGAAKPYVQHKAVMRSSDYKVATRAYEFTNQFGWDFAQLEAMVLENGALDLMTDIQSSIYPNIVAAATAFSAGNATSFKGGTPVTNANDYDALIALATVVNNNTFSAAANTALMSTFKQGRIACEKDTQGNYLMPPDFLKNIKMVGNPLVTGDNVLVGDLKQYNVQLRGGMIVKAGLVNDNLIRNKYTVVQEQLYFDYISEARKAALIKGVDFAAVKTLIST